LPCPFEEEFNLPTYPVNWPIGSGDSFRGVYHRPRREVHLFGKEASGKKNVKGVDKATAGLDIVPIDDPRQGLAGSTDPAS